MTGSMDLLAKGGFSFDLCRRNSMLEKNGLKLPGFRKTGTTIVGLIFQVLHSLSVELSQYLPMVRLSSQQQCCSAAVLGTNRRLLLMMQMQSSSSIAAAPSKALHFKAPRSRTARMTSLLNQCAGDDSLGTARMTSLLNQKVLKMILCSRFPCVCLGERRKYCSGIVLHTMPRGQRFHGVCAPASKWWQRGMQTMYREARCGLV